MRGSTEGPFKSTAGFEVGAGGSGPDGTNTTVIDSDGNFVGTLLAKATVVSSITGNVTLTADQSGTVFLVGTDTATITLPATVAGVMYTFMVNDTTDPVIIKPDSADKIQGKIILAATSTTFVLSGTNAHIVKMSTTNVAVGDNVSIIGDGGDGWIVLGGIGLGMATS